MLMLFFCSYIYNFSFILSQYILCIEFLNLILELLCLFHYYYLILVLLLFLYVVFVGANAKAHSLYAAYLANKEILILMSYKLKHFELLKGVTIINLPYLTLPSLLTLQLTPQLLSVLTLQQLILRNTLSDSASTITLIQQLGQIITLILHNYIIKIA